MFRDGQYLEVIKAADDCLAIVVVTVQERTVEIKDRKVITNKWLKIEDWAALYKILERAVLRNGRADGARPEDRGCECRKSTRQLEVTYTFEQSESASSATSLPTIKVHVSPARKKPARRDSASDETPRRGRLETGADGTKRPGEKSPDRTEPETKSDRPKKPARRIPPTEAARATAAREEPKKKRKSRQYELREDPENAPPEEYVPDAPGDAKRPRPDFKYVPSRKSALEGMRPTLNEYTPTRCDGRVAQAVNYVPNSVERLDAAAHETYEPLATTAIPDAVLEEYVPNSKGPRPAVEEYEPGFRSPGRLTFDDSYVPSSVPRKATSDSRKKTPGKLRRPERRKEKLRKKIDLFS